MYNPQYGQGSNPQRVANVSQSSINILVGTGIFQSLTQAALVVLLALMFAYLCNIEQDIDSLRENQNACCGGGGTIAKRSQQYENGNDEQQTNYAVQRGDALPDYDSKIDHQGERAALLESLTSMSRKQNDQLSSGAGQQVFSKHRHRSSNFLSPQCIDNWGVDACASAVWSMCNNSTLCPKSNHECTQWCNVLIRTTKSSLPKVKHEISNPPVSDRNLSKIERKRRHDTRLAFKQAIEECVSDPQSPACGMATRNVCRYNNMSRGCAHLVSLLKQYYKQGRVSADV